MIFFTSTFLKNSNFCAPFRLLPGKQDKLAGLESSNGENGEVLHVVEGLMGILKVSPEHSKAVASTVDLLKEQVMKIEELKGVLEAVRTELSSMVGGLDSADVLVIKSLQDMIYDVLDMLDDNDEGEAGSAAPPSSSSSTRIFNAA